MPNANFNMNVPNCFSYTTVNQRDNNEDYQSAFLLTNTEDKTPILVLAVADGMGGHEHGEDVSRQAVLKIRESLNGSIKQLLKQDSLNSDRLKQLLNKTIQDTNELVLRMVQVNGWKQAGSTIVVALVWGDRVIAANLGDSPLFHYAARKQRAVRVSQDHSVPGLLVQANLISEEMARYHERRGQLEYFLGADTLPPNEPVYEWQLEPDDLLLLCSDGVSGLLKLEQIEAILAHPVTSLEQKANQLIRTAKQLGETDNQTLILWQYKPSSLENSRSFSAQRLISAAKSENEISCLRSDLQTRNQEQKTLIQETDLISFSPHSLTARFRSLQNAQSLRRSRRYRAWRTWGMLLICLSSLATTGLLLLMLTNAFRGIPGAISLIPSPSNSSIAPQSQAPAQIAPAAPPVSKIPAFKITPYPNESGLTIEGFASSGTLLKTRNPDHSFTDWQVIGIAGKINCSLAVPKEFENRQSIIAVTPRAGSIPKSLLTLGENDCMRRWLFLQSNKWNLQEWFQSIFPALLK